MSQSRSNFRLCKMTNHILTWNLPAFVIYLTPLKGLYFSPYISSLLTLSPDTASCAIVNWTLIVGLVPSCVAPDTRFTLPLMLGSLVWSILPTSHISTLVTGSNEYLPWLATRLQFNTDFGIGISTLTCSTVRPIVCLGPTVMSSLPPVAPCHTRLCLT